MAKKTATAKEGIPSRIHGARDRIFDAMAMVRGACAMHEEQGDELTRLLDKAYAELDSITDEFEAIGSDCMEVNHG